MLTLNDGRSELWQWDTGRALSVDADCSQVHFSNKVFGRSIDVDVADGVAIIPDILLQTDKDLNVWAFVGTAENGYTKISKTFKVNRRNKPADYVFTPVEQTTIEEIAAIAQSVRDDADAGLFDGKPGENGRDGIDGKDGAPGKDGISATHSWNGTVLTITSASGTSSADLKGDKGDKGEQGEQGISGTAGHTPEYGVDYGTPEQIAEIAQQAAGILQPEVNQIKDDLSAEQTAREQADTSLQQEISGKLPKSPANWEPWTSEEQAAARERMGIPVGYDLIESFTLTDSGIFDRDTEPDGTPYNLRNVLVYRLYPKGVDLQDVSGYGRINFYNSEGDFINSECGKVIREISANLSLFENENNIASVKYSKTDSMSSSTAFMAVKIKKGIGWSFDFGNCFRVSSNPSDIDPAGTIVEIYGVRA